MPYNHNTGERYSNDNHKEFPISMSFVLDNVEYSIYRVDDIDNRITCVSKKFGFSYIPLDSLQRLLAEGKAVRCEEEV